MTDKKGKNMVEMSVEKRLKLVQLTADSLAGAYEAAVIAGAPEFSMRARCWHIFANSFREANTLTEQELAERVVESADRLAVVEEVIERYTTNLAGRSIIATELQGLRAESLAFSLAVTKGSFFDPDHFEKVFAGSGPVKLF